MNLGTDRFARPMHASVSKERRPFVAELGFELFCEKMDPRPERNASGGGPVDRVRARIAAVSSIDEADVPAASVLERREAAVLAARLRRFVNARVPTSLVVSPEIPGCGLINRATADVLITRQRFGSLAEPDCVEHLLYEVKSVDRSFRAVDMRQLITYAALMAADDVPPATVGIINPRLGTFVECAFDAMALDISGLHGDELLQQIIFDISVAEVSL